ncbi:CDPK-related kinase 3-like isoform X1 [Canna indica]|uniref:CDPK-related kinase 3-like isoform X1 n=1 Tax=Canna indica TaxID=4628 RepID=A0AAQ3K0U6_9LILI|nr:CDPK-related kinase 3-like isoform X1 [Canna indica]
MGQCYFKSSAAENEHDDSDVAATAAAGAHSALSSSDNIWPSARCPDTLPGSPAPPEVTPSPARTSTPRRLSRLLFSPPSPAKHIKSAIARRLRRPAAPVCGSGVAQDEVSGGGAPEAKQPLDKNFGYDRSFAAKYELDKEVGRGHFGQVCSARIKRTRGSMVAVKVIHKAKMTTAVSIDDVRREVKILKGLSHHENLVRFYDVCEDALNVYIVMELCEGGELLERMLSRGGSYTEEDAKGVVLQILNAVAFCHLQGVVHRDLKPENFLFTTRDETAPLKIIDFGLSDFIRPDEKLNDIVGSAYYVAPEVLHRSYSTEADIWSVGVITYILLCGSRPFWGQTESGIFRSVLTAAPSFDDSPWASVSLEAKDFIRRLLDKDYRKRMTAAQALTHPWLRDGRRQLPLDIFIFKLVKSYLHASPFKRAALKALSKTLTEKELVYIRSQFNLLEPDRDGFISFANFRTALLRNATDAMNNSKVLDILLALEPLSHRAMDFEEFCAAAISPYQLEALENWEQMSNQAFQYFEEKGNRVISTEELAQEMNLTPMAYHMVRDWTRLSDGKLNFLGYTKILHGVTIRNSHVRQQP